MEARAYTKAKPKIVLSISSMGASGDTECFHHTLSPYLSLNLILFSALPSDFDLYELTFKRHKSTRNSHQLMNISKAVVAIVFCVISHSFSSLWFLHVPFSSLSISFFHHFFSLPRIASLHLISVH